MVNERLDFLIDLCLKQMQGQHLFSRTNPNERKEVPGAILSMIHFAHPKSPSFDASGVTTAAIDLVKRWRDQENKSADLADFTADDFYSCLSDVAIGILAAVEYFREMNGPNRIRYLRQFTVTTDLGSPYKDSHERDVYAGIKVDDEAKGLCIGLHPRLFINHKRKDKFARYETDQGIYMLDGRGISLVAGLEESIHTDQIIRDGLSAHLRRKNNYLDDKAEQEAKMIAGKILARIIDSPATGIPI